MKTYWYDDAFNADSRSDMMASQPIAEFIRWNSQEDKMQEDVHTISDALRSMNSNIEYYWSIRGRNAFTPTQEQLEKAKMMNF